MCLKNHIVVAKCPKKIPHFDTINYHVYSELFHVHSGFSSTRDNTINVTLSVGPIKTNSLGKENFPQELPLSDKPETH